MKIMRRTLFLIPALALLSACASTPDPAEICTAEWITSSATKAANQIEKSAKSSFKTFADVSKTWASGKQPNLLQSVALFSAMNKMKKELTRGQGIKDLKTVAKTCNDPNTVKTSMHDLLERQGLSDNLIAWIENSPIYESLISTIAEPDPVKPNG